MLLRKSQEKKLLTKINKKYPYMRHFLSFSLNIRPKKSPLKNPFLKHKSKASFLTLFILVGLTLNQQLR